MRTVRLENFTYKVTDDPLKVIGDFVSCALSLENIYKRPPVEDFAERFSPEGDGMNIPDFFVAYRAEQPDDIPPELDEHTAEELGRTEIWVLSRLEYGKTPDSALIEGHELRHLLDEALTQRAARTAP
ncbi:hypothetical protein FHS43_001626 [Streptosporangium becharense]|uniref:Uncharacterized protein n=1 Tax=Streptosporangium becharense TaxID=1816182 RepID=A0A7W9MJW2_9ACTN|nr:hypothetical protein [Streptosporangium becharense]MBB2910363.1 hypothetical protein [Streptosporangium becharense]MBB5823106.1 hypothetical protein [Streptosporangium becharense]